LASSSNPALLTGFIRFERARLAPISSVGIRQGHLSPVIRKPQRNRAELRRLPTSDASGRMTALEDLGFYLQDRL
jgi:hypothetical protein